MSIIKEAENFGVPWEKSFGYSQAVKVGDIIYLSGQVSHDDDGNIVGLGQMETQMRQAYANVMKLRRLIFTALRSGQKSTQSGRCLGCAN